MKMRLFVILVILFLGSSEHVVTLSNTQLPRDTRGKLLITGESSSLFYEGDFYFFFNNEGGCAGVDCCDSPDGCASCCFVPPSPKYHDACVYGTNHSIAVYRTKDFSTWEYLGEALPNSGMHKGGQEGRPHVIHNKKTGLFVMWYADRWDGQTGYAVATSKTPQGPYTTIHDTVNMKTGCKIGDFDVFVDDDGTAYHVRTGFAIEVLKDDYMGVTGQYYRFDTPRPSEAPVMFKRKGFYYVIAGSDCCECRGGSNMFVFTSTKPLGPYKLQGDVGSNLTHSFDRHSPYNYVTRAQGSHVFQVPSSQKETTFVWYGNQWVSNPEKWPARNHDLLYFYPLKFKVDGNITQVEYVPKVQFVLY